MPARVYFANGQDIEVAEDPHQFFSRLNTGHGAPVHFDVPDGDDTKVVYINPQQVAYFEELSPREDRAPFVMSVPR